MYPQQLLLDPDVNLDEMSKEEVDALFAIKASESHMINREFFMHRGQRYIIGSDISLEAAHIICMAQWIGHKDRLWFAHALFEMYRSKPEWWLKERGIAPNRA